MDRWQRPATCCALLACLGFAAPALAKHRSLAVVEVSSPPYLSGIADEIARTAIQAAGHRFKLTVPDKVRAALGQENLDRLALCEAEDVGCRLVVLAPLGVDLAWGGTLAQSETSYVVHLWLLDLKSGKRVAQLDRSILIASRRLDRDLAEAIPKMLAGESEGNGELVVRSTPPAKLVSIDDEPAGKGDEVRKSVEPGKHRVVIEADGYLPTERWVQVAPDQELRVTETLLPVGGHIAEKPADTGLSAGKDLASDKPGFWLPAGTWVCLGLGAAALGTGLYFGLQANYFDHQAGHFDGNGVDQGLTRAQAVAGLNDTRTGNYLFIGAGVALVAAIVFAVATPRPLSQAAPTPAQPTAVTWSLP